MKTRKETGQEIARVLRWAGLALLLAVLGTSTAWAYNITAQVNVCTSGGPGLSGVTITCTCLGQTTRTGTTNASGTATVSSLTTGKTYTVTPSLSGYTFAPASTTVSAATTVSFVATPTGSLKYSITGTITKCSSGGLSGVTVRTNTGLTATTNSSGVYTISNVPASCTAYTLTPSLSGYTFAPATQSVTVLNANIPSGGTTNFIGTPTNLSISGTITDCQSQPVAGVTVTLGGAASGTATTDASGNYSFAGLTGCRTYTITPSMTGMNFIPASLSVSLTTTSSTGNNFTGVPNNLTISGRVTKCDGSALSGVTISLSPNAGNAPVTTDASGGYVITGISASCSSTTYTVTATLSGYTFYPTSQPVVVTGFSLQSVNFKEAPPGGGYTISGTVTSCGSALANVNVSTDSGALTTTDSSGNFTLSGLTGCTTYVVIPSLSGYTFTPGNLPVSVVRANVTGVNFTSTANAIGGWDPLKQVTLQILRPNLLIVQDVSGSMAGDIDANSVGVDSKGTQPTAAWSAKYWNGSSWTTPGGSTTATRWQYTLSITQTLASRMATVKNALGPYVDIWTPWEQPGTWSSDTTYSYVTDTDWSTATKAFTDNGDNTFTWSATYAAAHAAPGNPFTAFDGSNHPTVGTGGIHLPAQDIVGKTANRVNWGLMTFSGTTAQSVTAIDTTDSGNVTTLENNFKLNSAGGLGASGSTPTRTGLTTAGSLLATAYTNDTKRDCGRSFGVVLVTDGLSNNNNPGDANWISPCPCNGGGAGCCDAGSSGHNCPDDYTEFPAGVAETLWTSTNPSNVRTWAIGISNAVNPCEMNMDAYMGRTDASSPNGDTGFVTAADPYLPQSTGDTAHYQVNVGAHKDYAFFATTATALAYAFSSIVASVGSGDFSTAAPVVSTAISGGSDIAYLASAEAPSWKGHFYAYDVHDPASPVLNWDAGQKLSTRNFTTYPRIVYTWDGSNNLINLGAYTHTSGVPSGLTLPTGFDDRVLDYVKGFDGSSSSTRRAWILGPILNSTAAVFSAPEAWKPGSLPDHKAFEATYANRHPMVMVGTSDGMLHVFDVADGFEVYAILPPDQLANQVKLYTTYQASFGSRTTGEPVDPSAHVYGIAASPRFADVYVSSDYHTVVVLTEGRGGTTIAAIDVTHSYPGRSNVVLPDGTTKTYVADPNADTTNGPNYSALVSVLWSKTSSSLTGLAQTWSVPAVGATSASNFDCLFGSGYQGCSGYTPSTFSLNVGTGATRYSPAMTNGSSPAVSNQSYGAGVLFGTTTSVQKNYLTQNLGVTADTNGHVYLFAPSSGAMTTAMSVGVNQPIYYTPAVGYYAYSNKDVYAFASGNLYETSTAVTGTSPTVTPTLYLVAKTPDASAINASTDLYSVTIHSLERDTATHTVFSTSAQVTSDPVIFLPASAGNPVKAFFLVYDPKAGTCYGTSYLVELDFPLDLGGTSWKTGVTKSVLSLGEGAASGVAFSGGKIIVARSALSGGSVAPQVAGQGPNPLGEAPTLSSWTELK
jgi:hypothetical protein